MKIFMVPEMNHVVDLNAENGAGHSSKLNTASVVTISVIVTLAVVGCALLVYFFRKRALAKIQSTKTKNYVPQFNNI
jgi:NADH:ubiquinone oxidoreductase subunit K